MVPRSKGTDSADLDERAGGGLFVDDERFRAGGTVGYESSCGADGVIGPVQRHGIVRNAVPRDVPEVSSIMEST